jgi:hypothetical protein
MDNREINEWIAAHNAEIKAWWKEQWRCNRQCDENMERLSNRLRAVENRVVWFCGMAAGLGALLGTGLVSLIQTGGT